MRRRYPALGWCVRVSARVDQIGDDRPLAYRVPVRGAGFTDDRGMQRFGAAPVAGADVSAPLTVPADTLAGLAHRTALLDPPVSVDHHVMARRREGADEGGPLRWIVLDCAAIGDIDYTASAVLTRIIEHVHQRHVRFVVTTVLGPVRKQLDRYGISASPRPQRLLRHPRRGTRGLPRPAEGVSGRWNGARNIPLLVPADDEVDHGRLKARLRPMPGLKRVRSARIIAAGHAFIQNLAADTTTS